MLAYSTSSTLADRRRRFLRAVVRRCGLTLRDAAILSGVQFGTARAWACGQRSIDPAYLRQLLAALADAGYPPPPLPPPGVLDD